MSLATFEKVIVEEARVFFKNPKLRKKDLLEWSTSEIVETKNEEVVVALTHIRIYVCIKAECDKRKIK